ncbi:MAG: DUF134 domain-containing protein [Candidatus Omnitrophica bacterium]|nr:DUF134 domain-containing protein [Candidatus Omnitrophota bacterium]
MRPKKTRWVRCLPQERCFRPAGKSLRDMDGIVLSLDEIEAVRLADLEGLRQDKVAEKMKVHRSTISRILASAHKKIGDALVNLKAIKVEGGCCKFLNERGE